MGSTSTIKVDTLRNASPVLFARVVDSEGASILQAVVSAITYSVFVLHKDWPRNRNYRAGVTNHNAVSVDKTASVFDSLQTSDDRWTEDNDGYNFRHQLDVSANPCFEIAGRVYMVEFTITPTSGQDSVVQFEVSVY